MGASELLVETVGSGSYAIRKSRAGALQCHLGTCVGVALFDRENNIGGLYHIILPQPVESGTVWEPKNYASTGMPMFLKELYERGADKDNMEAVIAGGALIGPLSRRDLDLDLGGKTTDIVLAFLEKESITIARSETGGYFSCRLLLSLRTWETQIEPLGEKIKTPANRTFELTNKDIDETIARIRPIPQVALKVFRMMNSKDYNMQEIAKEIRQDQILGAKVINLSNTAFFNPRGKVASIDQALIMLGEKRLLQIVLSSSLELFFQDSGRGYSLCRGGIYHHSVSTAIAAENLAKKTRVVLPDVAYTAGLLHDIGKVVLDQYVAQAYPFFYRQIFEKERNSVEVERDLMGFSHPQTGERLAKLWDLSDVLIDVIKNHHNPEAATESPELVHLVYIADLLMSRFRVANELERIDTQSLLKSLKIIGFEMSELPLVIDAIPWTMLNEEISVKN
jgi:putative nucleotidyltransferase with HDIG domain